MKPGAIIYYLKSSLTLLAGIQNRGLLVKLFLHLPLDRPFEVYLKDGTRFSALTLMDIWVLKETILDRTYEKVGVPLKAGWMVVDIGAAEGDFAVWAARQVNPGRVIAVEPFPGSVDLLQENLAQNGIQNVVVHEGAVEASQGSSHLNLVTGEAAQHSTTNRIQSTGHIEVQTITLADLFERYALDRCDYLKLDCEGAEYGILFGSSRDLLQRVSRICMEVHDGVTSYSKEDMRSFLESQGYRVRVTPNPVHDSLAYLFAERLYSS